MVQVGSILHGHVLQVELVVVMVHVLFEFFVPIIRILEMVVLYMLEVF